MNNQELTLTMVLLISFLGGVLYSTFLEQIHDLYSPNWVWLTVVVGNGFVILTVAVLQWIAVPIDALIVLLVNVAWGLPVVAWQIWQWRQRLKQEKDASTENEGRQASS